MKEHKVIALFSGGLDSILAVKWMESRGYGVYPVYFATPYMKADRAIQSARDNGLELRIVDVWQEHLELLYKPVYGFGRWLNPCVDCHAFMFRQAAELMPEYGASFIISGEVLGQRPMSQKRNALANVSALSKVRDLIVRPLSQALLPDTLPVTEGWVDRADLLSINGRSRTAQFALAKELGITHYPSPAGGCALTDRNYCLRLQDLLDKHQETRENLELLAFGRHFRLSEQIKLIVGRSEPDNIALEQVFTQGMKLLTRDSEGPLGLIIGSEPDTAELQLALGIYLYYSKKAEQQAWVKVQPFENGEATAPMKEIMATKLDKETVKQYRISYD